MPTAAGLYYFEHGVEGKDKENVVLLHGAGGVIEQWPFQIRRLPGYRVLAPDLPEHGRSQGVAHSSIRDYASDCHKWLEAVGVTKAVVIGHSLGGAIAMNLALDFPNLISALVMVSSAAQLPVSPQLMDLLAVPIKVQRGVNKIVSWSLTQESDAGRRAMLFDQLIANRAGVLEKDYQACDSLNLAGRLHEIRVPSMFVIGSDDHMLSPRIAEETTKAIPNAKIAVIPGGGHMLQLERPQQLREIVEEFLQNRT